MPRNFIQGFSQPRGFRGKLHSKNHDFQKSTSVTLNVIFLHECIQWLKIEGFVRALTSSEANTIFMYKELRSPCTKLIPYSHMVCDTIYYILLSLLRVKY